MFLVGLDFRSDDFRAQGAERGRGVRLRHRRAVHRRDRRHACLLSVPGLFAADVSRFNATLFLGAAIAITAFPVLARIIHERGLDGTLIATLALSAAAIGDADRLVRGRGGAREPGRRRGGGRARDRRRLVLAAVLILLGPRLFAPLGRLAEREHARAAVEHHGARGGADVVHACRRTSPTPSACTRCSAAS